MGSLDLAGTTAVVTGAASGIGRALALEAADHRMALVLCDAAADGLEETAALVRARSAAVTATALDVRDAEALRALARGTPGPIGLLFANAGVLRTDALLSQAASDIQLMLDINVMGVVNTLQAFVPAMSAQARPSRAVITGSQASFAPFAASGGYCATKQALLAIAETLSMELAAEASPVSVSLLAPGSVATAIYGAKTSPNSAKSITPEAAAKIAFAGIARGDFVISTHADLGEMLERRLAGFRAMLGD